MESQRLGNTGITESRICLGCMSFGASEKITDRALREFARRETAVGGSA